MSDPTDNATDDQLFAEEQLARRVEQERLARETASGATHCVDCGEEIPVKRRELLPYATRCVDCQGFADLMDRRRR
ncbi:TraR/DksA family transcriptional regulator [Halomonas getboli]|uniref:TraR/DksA family transcriptional regulator n=1 Tax=Halomonas getboli TaxID=2935862 RepID=UPI001FFFB221|nr:TraR/DksA family transcriptional regulator [Halomonas getboli]